MELYTSTSYQLSRQLTMRYSTSFSKSSELFARIRPHIFAIYGLVRIADEIVDTYQGKKTATLLDALEQEHMRLYSCGTVLTRLFCMLSRIPLQKYGINKSIIAPF